MYELHGPDQPLALHRTYRRLQSYLHLEILIQRLQFLYLTMQYRRWQGLRSVKSK